MHRSMDDRGSLLVLQTALVRAAVQARRTMSSTLHPTAGRDDAAARLDLAAEVRRVQVAGEDHFVDLSQLGKGEVPGQQLKGHVSVTDLVAQPPERVPKDFVVVEGELLRQGVDREPACLALARRW